MLMMDLRDFLISVYKIDYQYYEFGYCHKHNHSNIGSTFDPKIAKMFPAVKREIVEEVIRDFKIKHFERQYDAFFYEELKLKLTSKVKTDIKNLCKYLKEDYLMPVLTFSTNNIVIPCANSIKKAILIIYNKKFEENYTWDEFEKENLKGLRAVQPHGIKEHLKYTEKDVIPASLHLLNEFEKYFNTGYNLFQFDVSQIKVNASYEYNTDDVIYHIKAFYPEAHINNPNLYSFLKRREVERIKEEEQKQLKKQQAKERRKQLKELSKRGGVL
jgi:hypothetical protein